MINNIIIIRLTETFLMVFSSLIASSKLLMLGLAGKMEVLVDVNPLDDSRGG